MPRPKKNRMVCHVPDNLAFSPADGAETEPVILAVDEYETIRLIDWENLSQEQCAERTKDNVKKGFFKWVLDGILRIFAPLC